MDKNSIEVFLTAAEEGSFRKTADRLGYTQAGVSYIINTLEKELGLVLFIRERTGTRLTPEGQALIPHLKQLDSDIRALRQSVRELKGLEKGTVRVQIFDSISIHWIPGIISEFNRDYPGITVELISEEDSIKAEEMVMSGEVDCGFFLTDVSSSMDVYPLKVDRMLAIVSPQHELAGARRFPVARLGDFPYISMKYDHHTGIQKIFDKYNAVPDTVYQIDNDFAAMAMVSKNLGYGIFPELLLQDVPFDLIGLEFDKPQTRTISIGLRSEHSASLACLKFIEYVRNWVGENCKTT